MEYGPKTSIFGLKYTMKSGLEKILLKFLNAYIGCFLINGFTT
jgi:hypothetical protein